MYISYVLIKWNITKEIKFKWIILFLLLLYNKVIIIINISINYVT